MDAKAQQWQKRFEMIWERGQYRQGSCGQRMTPLFLDLVPEDAVINEYGCGTGRAVVEILNHRRHRINLVDIATNALDQECRELLAAPDSPLTFTHASLDALPEAFPIADWGYCVGVLMLVQPERLDAVLGEIRRTCRNLFAEVYDWPDVRCGIDLTTIKGDGLWWSAKLSEHWPHVTYEPSPEHKRRSILICRSEP